MPGKASVPLERYYEAFAGRRAGVRARPGLDLHPGRPRRHAGGHPRRCAERLIGDRRLPLRRAVRADLAARRWKSHPAPVAGVHARASSSRSRDMLAAAGLRSADIKAGCGRCGACSALSAYERLQGRRMIFDPVAALPAEPASAIKFATAPWERRRRRGAAPARCSAREQGSSRATTATPIDAPCDADLRALDARRRRPTPSSAPCGSTRCRSARRMVGLAPRRGTPITAASAALGAGLIQRRRGVGPCARLHALPRPCAEPERRPVRGSALDEPRCRSTSTAGRTT